DVVDNAPSTPATQDAVAAMPWVRYRCEPKVGLDFARNCAWRSASSDFVAYVDDDVELDETWLDGLMRTLRAHPDAGAITGLVLPLTLADDAHILFEKRGGFRRGFVPRRWRGAADDRDMIYPLGAGLFGAGANMAVRRSLLEALGGFDEALDTGAPLPGGGDLDIFYRVLRSGHPLVYEPGMSVRHEHRSSLESLRRQYYTWGLGFFAFLGKVWETEPSERPRIRLLSKWWLLDFARMIRRRYARIDPTPVDLAFSELAGAIEGLAGEYRRSRTRVAEIRRRVGR
ncbi:MAG TPA: glycosyltransferase, partial [Gemmatimonadaceae bacterium]|nr:glycosyltransferase [Gemmatimonadaceae bacterium]